MKSTLDLEADDFDFDAWRRLYDGFSFEEHKRIYRRNG